MTPKPTTVIYHRADFDGILCREIARMFLPHAELIGWDYGDATPLVAMDRELYILDLAVPDLMIHPGLIWIDHHASSIAKYDPAIAGYRIDGVAACRLAWQWFNMGKVVPQSIYGSGPIPENALRYPVNVPSTKEPYVERRVWEPWAVRLVGEWDIWDKRDDDAALLQHGLCSRDLSKMWPLILELDQRMSIAEIENLKSLDPDGTIGILRPDGTAKNPHVNALLRNGKSVMFARTQDNETIIKNFGFTLLWEGLTWLACNSALYNSTLFTSGLTPEHDACFGFKWTGRDWSVSLYHAPGKEHHDLSKIAVKYGGGGHKGACGFKLKELPDFL